MDQRPLAISILVITLVSMVSLALMLYPEMTGYARGYDWDYQAVIAYGGYQLTVILKSACQHSSIPQEYTVPMSYRDAINLGLNVYDDCIYTYHLTSWPGYCCDI